MSNYLSTAEVAARLNVSVDTVRNYCKSGRLRCIRPGGRDFRIPPEALDRFEESAAEAHVAEMRAQSNRILEEAIAAGRIPPEVPPEVLGRIAGILRQHYAEQAERTSA